MSVYLCEKKVCVRDTPCEGCDCEPEKDFPALVFRLRHERNFWAWKCERRDMEIEALVEELTALEVEHG